MIGGERASVQPVARPVAPDAQHVAVEIGHVVAGGPQNLQRTADASTVPSVTFIMLPVDTEAGPVVLTHGVHSGRIVDRATVVLVRFGAHLLRCGLVPGIRVGIDDAFGGLIGLSQEKPVPPACGERRITTSQRLPNRDGVQHADGGHGFRVVQSKASGHVRAPVVSNDGEPFVPEAAHDRQAALGVRPAPAGYCESGVFCHKCDT
ncbi:hypothetical protein GCM10010244_80610 [Streptomyces coeruleorubidus]|nr:hypothetical protein GCM10010244_80610 [Streptomyces bellus]